MSLGVLLLDVDGVLTDGRLYFGGAGEPLRAFDIQDGFAIRWYQQLGGVVGIVTGKESQAVRARAAELDIRHVVQGSRDKHADATRICETAGASLASAAAMGDDLPDLPMLLHCGYPLAPANAVPEVRAAARYVTGRPGGRGAVREAIEHLLRRAGMWERVVAAFSREPGPAPAVGMKA